MILGAALAHHEGALRASLRATYGIDLREARSTMRADDLAELVGWMPAGCALWQDIGGPAAISAEARELRRIGYWLRVLDFRERGSKGDKPKPDPEPLYAHERRERDRVQTQKLAAHLNRHRVTPQG